MLYASHNVGDEVRIGKDGQPYIVEDALTSPHVMGPIVGDDLYSFDLGSNRRS